MKGLAKVDPVRINVILAAAARKQEVRAGRQLRIHALPSVPKSTEKMEDPFLIGFPCAFIAIRRVPVVIRSHHSFAVVSDSSVTVLFRRSFRIQAENVDRRSGGESITP